MLSSQGKLRETKRLASGWAAAVLAVALAGCGGGGGGSTPGQGPGPAPEPPPPPPPAVAQLEGRLWHNNYALDYRSGTQIASLEGKLPVYASSNTSVSPWPDGTQFILDNWNVYDDDSDLQVIDLATGQTLYSAKTEGYLRDSRPSPASKTLMMATIGKDSISPADTIFVDLTTMTVLRRFSADDPVNWLPDGRYLRMLGDGTLRIGDLAGAEVDAGRIQPPAAHTVQYLWVSPKGDQVAWSIQHNVSPTPEVDLWVSKLDGSGLERVTQTKMSGYAHWSPDGSKIAFEVDTGHFCNGIGCMGSCDLWWVPATARNVVAVPASEDAWQFKVKDTHGNEQTLGCALAAWTK
jgi:hypothetical protein